MEESRTVRQVIRACDRGGEWIESSTTFLGARWWHLLLPCRHRVDVPANSAVYDETAPPTEKLQVYAGGYRVMGEVSALVTGRAIIWFWAGLDEQPVCRVFFSDPNDALMFKMASPWAI